MYPINPIILSLQQIGWIRSIKFRIKLEMVFTDNSRVGDQVDCRVYLVGSQTGVVDHGHLQ